MSSNLPDEDNDKSVDTFGIGTYDDGFDRNNKSKGDVKKNSLPMDGGPFDPIGPDRLLSYPSMSYASSILPADPSTPPRSKKKESQINPNPIPSVAETSLPNDKNNPAARSDYYDKMSISGYDSPWAKDDTGVYAGTNESDRDLLAEETEREIENGIDLNESLPTPASNFVETNNFMKLVNDGIDGHVSEDQNVPYGSPSPDFLDQSVYDKRGLSEWQDGGTVITSNTRPRFSTNIEKVRALSKEFLKDYGKKDLTRRHIMNFLKSKEEHQYLASDIIRNLKINHDVFVKDVLDEFPVRKASVASMHDKVDVYKIREILVNLACENINDEYAFKHLHAAAAKMSDLIALLERNF